MNDSSQGRERNLESSFESSRGLKRREYAVERTGGSKQISDPGRRERGASGERGTRSGPLAGGRGLAREMSQFRRVAGPGYVTGGAGRVGAPPRLQRRSFEGAGPQVAGPRGVYRTPAVPRRWCAVLGRAGRPADLRGTVTGSMSGSFLTGVGMLCK